MKRMNLQFFGEEGETPEVAEPEVVETEEPEEVEEVDTETPEPTQSAEENAVYAKIRRKAEEDAKHKYEMQSQQERARMDAFYAEQCKGKVNPETGMPIRTEAEYREALAAQERVQLKAQMQDSGVDPSLIDRAIMNNPVVQQAQQAIIENQNVQVERMMQEDIEAIIALDPTVNSREEVEAQDTYQDCVRYCVNHPGIRLSDAYKIVNFDRLASTRTEAAKQSAINAAKSKGHLSTPNGSQGGNELSDIPESILNDWKEWFPEKSPKELKALYNKSIA